MSPAGVVQQTGAVEATAAGGIEVSIYGVGELARQATTFYPCVVYDLRSPLEVDGHMPTYRNVKRQSGKANAIVVCRWQAGRVWANPQRGGDSPAAWWRRPHGTNPSEPAARWRRPRHGGWRWSRWAGRIRTGDLGGMHGELGKSV
jgi:hypothetical protein